MAAEVASAMAFGAMLIGFAFAAAAMDAQEHCLMVLHRSGVAVTIAGAALIASPAWKGDVLWVAGSCTGDPGLLLPTLPLSLLLVLVMPAERACQETVL